MESSPFWPSPPNRNTDNSVQREKPGTSDGQKRAGTRSPPKCLPAPPGPRWPQTGCGRTGSKERSVHPHSGAGGGHPACLPLVNSTLSCGSGATVLPGEQWVAGMSQLLQLHSFVSREMEVHPAQPAVTWMPTYLAPRTRDRKGPCLQCQSAQGQSCESVTSR